MTDLRALGIEPRHMRPGTQRLRCPRCDRPGRDDALALTVGGDGSFVWYCHRCQWSGGSGNSKAPDLASWKNPAAIGASFSKVPDPRHLRAAVRAREIWAGAQPAPGDHGYVRRKRLEGCGLRFVHKFQSIADAVLIPMRDSTGAIVNVQGVNPSGRKLFMAGGQTKGAFALVSVPDSYWHRCAPPDRIAIGEGFATVSAFMRMACEYLGVAALSAGNLVAVAKIMRERFARAEIIILGDRDEAGANAAFEAARAIDTEVWFPKASPDVNDWSDLELHNESKRRRA